MYTGWNIKKAEQQKSPRIGGSFAVCNVLRKKKGYPTPIRVRMDRHSTVHKEEFIMETSKWLKLSAAAFLSAGMLAACGGDNDDDNLDEKDPVEEQAPAGNGGTDGEDTNGNEDMDSETDTETDTDTDSTDGDKNDADTDDTTDDEDMLNETDEENDNS